MMSVMTVTRKRPDFYKRLTDNLLKLADKPELLEFIIYRDSDDDSIYEYPKNHIEIVGERVPHAEMWNECYKRTKYDIVFGIPDDFNPYTRGWDTAVYEAFEQYPDKIVFIYPNDRKFKERFGCIWWMHKNWVDTIGYFAVPHFSCWCIDNWWFDIAKSLNRLHYLGNVIFKHDWAGMDETHMEFKYTDKRSRDRHKRLYRRDDMVKLREEETNKLQRFIDSYQNDVNSYSNQKTS